MKLIFKLVKGVLEIGLFLLAGFIVLYLSYYFGWTMLIKGVDFGNDMASALNNVFYLEQWYPPIPGWNHLWSGGMPFLQYYPNLPFLITFFIHKFFDFGIYKAMRLVMFFSVPLTALGVVVLGRIMTKNWLIGILAGVLMILSPDSWLWITVGGFFAVAASAPAFSWALVFFCLAMEKEKFWLLILAAFFFGMAWLFHPTAGMLLAVVMVILGLGYSLKNYGFKGSWKGITKTAWVGFLGIALFAWWIFPFLTREDVGGITIGADQMYRATLRELLGFDLPESSVYITSTFYATSAVILFVLGSFVAFFRKSILRWAVLACGLAVFIITAPHYAQPIVKVFQLFWASTNVRSGLILRVLGPIIGAYGAASLIRPGFWLAERFARNLKEKRWWFYLTEIAGGIMGFAILILLLQKGPAIIPPLSETGDSKLLYSGYGPFRNWISVKKVGNQLITMIPVDGKLQEQPLFKDYHTILQELPKIVSLTGDSSNSGLDQTVAAMIKASSVTEKDRIDANPMGGAYVETINNFSQVGQVEGYVGTSMIQRMIGWKADCAFINVLCGSSQVADLYKWFGVKQIWYQLGGLESEKPKDLAKFEDINFFEPKNIPLKGLGNQETNLKTFNVKDAVGLASISNKPAILVIGGNPPSDDSFDLVFRGLSKVNFGYDKAWSVHGRRFIDDYSLEELSKFELVLLHGYQYRNQVKAWSLLEKYVNAGGNLFVNTGWQYQAKDWGKENQGVIEELVMPKVIPVEKTKWGKIEKGKWDLKLGNSSLVEGVTINDWGEPLWSGLPWGAASAQKISLKKGATSLLENNGLVLFASWEVGKGKVVWTGFDFWGHLVNYQANDERQFVNKILQWLTEGQYFEDQLDFERKTPDLVTINFQNDGSRRKLLFKEVASDYWQSSLLSGSQKIKLATYKAGPGWRMVFLPDNPVKGQVVFSFGRNKVGKIGLILSVSAFIFALTILFLNIFKKDWPKQLFDLITKDFMKKKQIMENNWKEEDR